MRIIDPGLGDGGVLIAFGWRHPDFAPDGVIAVPARVARVAERLVAADPGFAAWWHRLLMHEVDFHIDRGEHTGTRHDTHAAALADDFEAAAAARRSTPVRAALALGRDVLRRRFGSVPAHSDAVLRQAVEVLHHQPVFYGVGPRYLGLELEVNAPAEAHAEIAIHADRRLGGGPISCATARSRSTRDSRWSRTRCRTTGRCGTSPGNCSTS